MWVKYFPIKIAVSKTAKRMTFYRACEKFTLILAFALCAPSTFHSLLLSSILCLCVDFLQSSLITSVLNMRGTTHSNELIWHVSMGANAKHPYGGFVAIVITCNHGLFARNSQCHGQLKDIVELSTVRCLSLQIEGMLALK